ncbi:hypothetical protein [Flagellimonas sp. 2504JD4-2]
MHQIRISKEYFNKKLVFAVIFVPLLIDCLMGVFEMIQLDFSIGKVYRGLLWFLGVIYLLRRKSLSFMEFFVPFWLLHCGIWFFLDEKFDFVYEFSFLSKATYFFVILGVLSGIKIKEKKDYVGHCLKLYFKVASGLICFSFLTKIGIPAYDGWGFGTKSFFLAANDIGISILLLFSFFLFNRTKYNIHWLWLLIGYLSLIFLGTTTGMMVSTLVVGLYILVEFFMAKMGLIKRIVIVFASVIVVISSSIALYRVIQSTPYFINKYEKILSKGVRSDVTEWSLQYFDERPTAKNVFGEGISSFSKNFVSYASGEKGKKFEKGAYVERDYHDLKGAYGLILLWALISAYAFFYVKIILRAWNTKNIYYYSIALVVSLAFLHGYMAGHVFYSPTVAGVLASIFLLGLKTQEKKKTQ